MTSGVGVCVLRMCGGTFWKAAFTAQSSHLKSPCHLVFKRKPAHSLGGSPPPRPFQPLLESDEHPGGRRRPVGSPRRPCRGQRAWPAWAGTGTELELPLPGRSMPRFRPAPSPTAGTHLARMRSWSLSAEPWR